MEIATGPGMGRGIQRAGVLRREAHGSRKLEKSSVGGPQKGGVTGRGEGWGKGGSPGSGALFLSPKFNSAAAAQEEVSGATAQPANRCRPR